MSQRENGEQGIIHRSKETHIILCLKTASMVLVEGGTLSIRDLK